MLSSLEDGGFLCINREMSDGTVQYQTIVVKIGSSSLTSDEGGLNRSKIVFFAAELARLHRQGFQLLLVTSGAVAAGFREIGYAARPKNVHEKQASASCRASLANAGL